MDDGGGSPDLDREPDSPACRNRTGFGRIPRSGVPCIEEAEAQVVVRIARIVVVPIGAADVPGIVVPAAAAFDPVGASASGPGPEIPVIVPPAGKD